MLRSQALTLLLVALLGTRAVAADLPPGPPPSLRLQPPSLHLEARLWENKHVNLLAAGGLLLLVGVVVTVVGMAVAFSHPDTPETPQPQRIGGAIVGLVGLGAVVTGVVLVFAGLFRAWSGSMTRARVLPFAALGSEGRSAQLGVAVRF